MSTVNNPPALRKTNTRGRCSADMFMRDDELDDDDDIRRTGGGASSSSFRGRTVRDTGAYRSGNDVIQPRPPTTSRFDDEGDMPGAPSSASAGGSAAARRAKMEEVRTRVYLCIFLTCRVRSIVSYARR